MELPDIPFNKAEYIETVSKIHISTRKTLFNMSLSVKRPLEIE